jgi:lycopene beta-cyclase
MLFAAAEPRDRYRVLQRFYGLDQRLIERFYAGRSTRSTRCAFWRAPPVSISKAIGVLTGLGARPQPLHHSSQSPSGVRK